MIVFPRKQAAFAQNLFAEFSFELVSEQKPRIGRESDAELLDGVLIESSSGKIFSCPRTLRSSQAFLKKRASPFMDFKERSPQTRVFGFGFGVERLLGERHSDLLGDGSHRLGKRDVLDFLDETEYVARDAAPEAMEELARSVDGKRWRLFFMKWAQARVILSSGFSERDVLADYADDIRLQL